MKNRAILSILGAFAWISVSEFFRNQYLLKYLWEMHFSRMGLVFPAEPVNGALWGLWALVFASVIYILSTKFSFNETIWLSWVIGFLMMWLVIGNLNVLPTTLLIYALPLSIVECYVAVYIIRKLA